ASPALTPVWTLRPRAAARTCASLWLGLAPPPLTLVFTCMVRSPRFGRVPAGPRSRHRRRPAWLCSFAPGLDGSGIGWQSPTPGETLHPTRGKRRPGGNASFLALTGRGRPRRLDEPLLLEVPVPQPGEAGQ